MLLSILYGKDRLKLDTGAIMPALITPPGKKHGKFNASNEFRKALARPDGTKPLKKIVKQSDTVAIVVPDKTRPNAFKPLLPILLAELHKTGIKKDNITFIIATGTHSGHTQAEKTALLGNIPCKQYKIIDHDCHDEKNMRYAGATARGTEVYYNRHVFNADKVITIGIAGYHYYAGYNGGRKTIMPGVAGYNSIQQNHSLVFNPPDKGGKNPLAISGMLKGNPVHEDMLESAKLLGVDFSINLILDTDKNIAGIFAGDMEKSHLRACKELDRLYHAKIKGLADCVIVSAGGYPRDINYVQAHKSIETASKALKPGGTMLVFAECVDGFGSERIKQWFKAGSPAVIEKRLRRKFEVPGNTVLSSLAKSDKFNIYLYSGMSKEDVGLMGLKPLTDIGQAEDIINAFSNKKIYAIPDGNSVMPK
ncbi:MAG: nickel-dependent lactate racemase [Planctomycetes bacterium]|nr:nickel-dependent lactate racemase [Planctomycetota bacterium]